MLSLFYSFLLNVQSGLKSTSVTEIKTTSWNMNIKLQSEAKKVILWFAILLEVGLEYESNIVFIKEHF